MHHAKVQNSCSCKLLSCEIFGFWSIKTNNLTASSWALGTWALYLLTFYRLKFSKIIKNVTHSLFIIMTTVATSSNNCHAFIRVSWGLGGDNNLFGFGFVSRPKL